MDRLSADHDCPSSRVTRSWTNEEAAYELFALRRLSNRGSCEHEEAVAAHLTPDPEADPLSEAVPVEHALPDSRHEDSDSDDVEQDDPEMTEWISTLPRRVLPCRADRQAINDLLFEVAGLLRAQNQREAGEQSEVEATAPAAPRNFVAYDNCRFVLTASCS